MGLKPGLRVVTRQPAREVSGMTPAVGDVLPIGGEALRRLGSLIEGNAQGAGDVAGEKGVAGPGVKQHKHPSSVLHLVLDCVDFDFAEKLGFVVGLETRQLLGRRFHTCAPPGSQCYWLRNATAWVSGEPCAAAVHIETQQEV